MNHWLKCSVSQTNKIIKATVLIKIGIMSTPVFSYIGIDKINKLFITFIFIYIY